MPELTIQLGQSDVVATNDVPVKVVLTGQKGLAASIDFEGHFLDHALCEIRILDTFELLGKYLLVIL